MAICGTFGSNPSLFGAVKRHRLIGDVDMYVCFFRSCLIVFQLYQVVYKIS